LAKTAKHDASSQPATDAVERKLARSRWPHSAGCTRTTTKPNCRPAPITTVIKTANHCQPWAAPRTNFRSARLEITKNGPTRYVHLYKALQRAVDATGIPDLSWHDLRRTCGCRLLQDHRLSMEVVSMWLGHSSIKVTERHYAFLDVRHLHAALEDRKILNLRSKSAVLGLEHASQHLVDTPSKGSRFSVSETVEDV
jgi:hypothetical protein